MNIGGKLMFKTNDLYELISWLFLSLFWFGKTLICTRFDGHIEDTV